MNHRSFRPLLIMFTLFALIGCSHPGRPITAERNPFASMWYPTSGDDPVVIDIAGPIELDVVNFAGDVIITADERERNVSVRVIRRAVHGAARYTEGRESLREIDYTVRTVPGELGPRLEVRTNTTHPEPYYQRAHLLITAPEIDGVYVRTLAGRVHARGVEGRIDIATTDGEVRVMTSKPIRQPITINNDRGDIEVRVRGESAGFIDAEAIGGRVTHRIRHGRLTIDNGLRTDRLSARFNNGENPITLRTEWGNIHFAAVSDPERVGFLIAD